MTRMSLYFRFCWSMLMFFFQHNWLCLSGTMSRTWVCVPSPPRWTKVGAYYCDTHYRTAGWWRSNHRPKKYFFGNRTLTHFCIFVFFFAMWRLWANSKNDFCSLCMSVCASFGGCGLLRWVTVRTLVLSGLSLLTDDVVRYIPKNCPLMETLDVSGCVQLTDCR